MRPKAIEHVILVAAILVSLLCLDLLPPGEMLGQVARGLLAWAVFSTLLVASAGAWIALRRSLRRSVGHTR